MFLMSKKDIPAESQFDHLCAVYSTASSSNSITTTKRPLPIRLIGWISINWESSHCHLSLRPGYDSQHLSLEVSWRRAAYLLRDEWTIREVQGTVIKGRLPIGSNKIDSLLDDSIVRSIQYFLPPGFDSQHPHSGRTLTESRLLTAISREISSWTTRLNIEDGKDKDPTPTSTSSD